MTELETKIWNTVHNWCDSQSSEIPDQNRRYLMDEMKALVLSRVMPRFSKQDVIDRLKQRDKEAFDNPYQKYEHREINQAIDIIKRLMPPSSFPNGA